MKNQLLTLLLSIVTGIILPWSSAGQNTFPSNGSAGIGTTTPNASALLELKSTTKGLLISRMTKAQRDAITAPVTGLMIYQTNSTPGFYYFSGTSWTAVGANTTLSNLNSTTSINASLLPAADNAIDLGSSSRQYRSLYLYNLHFSDGSVQTTASSPTAGAGISISGTTISLANGTAAGQVYITGSSPFTPVLQTVSGDANLNNTGALTLANSGVAAGTYTKVTVDTKGRVTAGTTLASADIPAGSTKYIQNQSASDQSVSFRINGNGIFAAGKVGIGTTSPAAKLEVSGGDALINGLTVGKGSGNISANTAIGFQALLSNTTGSSNTATGNGALFSNKDGGNNTATGYGALYTNTVGTVNTANGNQALFFNTMGNFNNAIGNGALFFNTMGSNNTADGNGALNSNTIGNSNTAMGYAALLSNTTGSFNTALGYDADVSSENLLNATAIGFNASIDASNKVRIGNADVTSIGGQVSWSTFSDGRYKKNIREDVRGLAFINSLKPITYTVDINGLNTYMHRNSKHDAAYEKMNKEVQPAADEASKIIYNGFVAQEVEAAANKLHYNFSGVDKPKTADGLYGLRYSDFVVPLVKAVQELSKINDDKDAKIEAQDKKIEEQDKKIDALLSIVQTLQQNFEKCNPCSQLSAGNDQQLHLDHQHPIAISGASLEQNTPNPFASGTTINYTLPQQYSSAMIIVTDKLGKKLKEINVSGSGKGSVKVEASTLANGAYQYSLYVNGKLVDTKQMVLQH